MDKMWIKEDIMLILLVLYQKKKKKISAEAWIKNLIPEALTRKKCGNLNLTGGTPES